MEKRPDELAADVFQAKFEMGVLVYGVVAAEESGGADVETLFIVDFFGIDEAGRVTGAGSGDGGVEWMREGVAESDARGSRLDEFGGITGMEHARLSGHVGKHFTRKRGWCVGERKQGKNLTQSAPRTQRAQRKTRKEGTKEGKEGKREESKGFKAESEGRRAECAEEDSEGRDRGKEKGQPVGLSLVRREMRFVADGLGCCCRWATATAWAALLFCGGGFGSGVGVFLGEAFDAARSVHQLLLAGEERVATGANFNVQPVPFDGGTGLEIASASAMDGYGVIVGVNAGLHESPFCRGRSAPKPASAGSTEASLGREVTPHYSKEAALRKTARKQGVGQFDI